MKQVTSPAASRPAPFARRGRGFTTIELLIAMVILGILMAVALPSYQSSMRKSRRAEAFTALSGIQQSQERLRSTSATYASSVTDATTATPPGLGLASRTGSGYYDLSLASASATGYIATATAVTGTSQAADGDCAVLAVNVTGGNVRYGAGATINWASPDPQRCWAR